MSGLRGDILGDVLVWAKVLHVAAVAIWIGAPPGKAVDPEGGDDQRDEEMRQHGVDRMAGERHGRAGRGLDYLGDRRISHLLGALRLPHASRTARAALGFPALAGCGGPLSTLDPAGPPAEAIATLWWIMLAGAAAIALGMGRFSPRPGRAGRVWPRLPPTG